MVKTVLVGTHDGLRAAVYAGLRTCCSLLDTHLGHAGLDSLSHSAELLDFLYVLPSLVRKLVGEALNIVRTCPRVDMLAYLGLILNVNLGVAGYSC